MTGLAAELPSVPESLGLSRTLYLCIHGRVAETYSFVWKVLKFLLK